MKKNGVTRKIDELGRIVIPKEIRKNLKIRNNDELLIDVSDESIVLSKYMKVGLDEVLKYLVEASGKVLNKDVLITSKDRVIVSSDPIYYDHELSNSLVKKIEKNETSSSLVPTKVSLFNEIVEVAYLISPFSISSGVIGSVIIFSSDTINNDCVLTSNIIKKFLEKYLEDE